MKITAQHKKLDSSSLEALRAKRIEARMAANTANREYERKLAIEAQGRYVRLEWTMNKNVLRSKIYVHGRYQTGHILGCVSEGENKDTELLISLVNASHLEKEGCLILLLGQEPQVRGLK